MIFYIIGGITAVIIFVVLKDKLWDKPHREIEILKSDIKKLQRLHREEIIKLDLRMRDGSNLHPGLIVTFVNTSQLTFSLPVCNIRLTTPMIRLY